MSYEKLGFTSGQVLKADHLNHIESGFENIGWNDLTDKPFGEVVYGDTLTWDGNTEGLATDGSQHFKVSDLTPSVKELKVWTEHIVFADGRQRTSEYEADHRVYDGMVEVGSFVVVYDEHFSESPVYPEPGIYFYANEYWRCESITLPGCGKFLCTKTIDTAYLPEPLRFGTSKEIVLTPVLEEITVNKTGGVLMQIDMPDLDIGRTYVVTFDGVEYECECRYHQWGWCIGNITLVPGNVDENGNNGEPFCIISKELAAEKGEHTVSIHLLKLEEVTKTLDPKYLQKATAVADVTDAPTAEEFNALLNALREAGYLAE